MIDQAEILSAVEERELERLLADHERATTNQLVVVALKHLHGADIDDYGYRLGRHWGIGQQSADNGLLLLVASAERKIRIEVGYGLEGSLTDALSHRIIQERMLPSFREGRLSAGIRDGVSAIVGVLERDQETLAELQSGGLGLRRADRAAPIVLVALILLQMLRSVVRSTLVTYAASALTIPAFWWVIGSLPLALGVWLALAFLLYLFSQGAGRGPFRGGGIHRGGGFSGGGGSFGGGGAAGGW